MSAGAFIGGILPLGGRGCRYYLPASRFLVRPRESGERKGRPYGDGRFAAPLRYSADLGRRRTRSLRQSSRTSPHPLRFSASPKGWEHVGDVLAANSLPVQLLFSEGLLLMPALPFFGLATKECVVHSSRMEEGCVGVFVSCEDESMCVLGTEPPQHVCY